MFPIRSRYNILIGRSSRQRHPVVAVPTLGAKAAVSTAANEQPGVGAIGIVRSLWAENVPLVPQTSCP